MTMVTVPVYKKRRRTAQKAAASESTPIDQAHLIQDGFFAQTSWIDFNSSTSTHWHMITLDEIGNESAPVHTSISGFCHALMDTTFPAPRMKTFAKKVNRQPLTSLIALVIFIAVIFIAGSALGGSSLECPPDVEDIKGILNDKITSLKETLQNRVQEVGCRMVKILFCHNYAAKSACCNEKSVKFPSVSVFLLR